MQDWWLDIVCKKSWDVALYKDKGGKIVGVLPYFLNKYWGFKVITMPPLTPYMGVWINYPSNSKKLESKYRLEKKVIPALIEQLPKAAYYAQRHPTTLKNHLPFHWQGYQQTSFYTFIIYKKAFSNVYDGFKSSVRNDIQRAQGKLTISETQDLELFYELNKKSFQRQNVRIPYSLLFLKKIDEALTARNQRTIFIAKDKEGNKHAGIYLAWDEETMYSLMIGADTNLRSSGAVQLLLWEGIQLAIKKNLNFDFEGGMMENIENIFRAFGGEMVGYHKIYKGENILFRFISALRNT